MDRLISKNKVLEAIDNLKANFTCYDSVTLDEVASHVKAIPSPEPKAGNWILDDSDDSMICDKCECTVYVLDMVDGAIHYCPNCGDKKEGITWID